ncbi:GNAT family N-acetyltransferase ['Paenibacillus yunnanensis' Narsing Rao et al. 2020]|uniref:GNAT family N-acetyltransferase n=1 Tax=Paenibacillus tengchongensis TaxID=2608684 RepID=UPI00124E0901|nr:GNAT family protein [Paenibacillus tengchongensis]
MPTNDFTAYSVNKMTEKEARSIAEWRYEAPYELYNVTGDLEEILQELLDGSYYAVRSSGDELVGFFCYGRNAQVPGGLRQGLYTGESVIDIGLGLKPELTGRGLGLEFLRAGIAYAARTFAPRKLRLSVAAFNTRAIALYSKAGFDPAGQFDNTADGQTIRFVLMEMEVPASG